MHEEQTFVDDFSYTNASGSSTLLKFAKEKSNVINKDALVGIDFNTSNTKFLGSMFSQSEIAKLIKSQERLNTLFSRLRYETNSVQRTAIIKEIEEIRPTIINSVKDFDKISQRLRAMLFVDLSKPITFEVISKRSPLFPEVVIPVNVDAATPKPIIDMGTPKQTGSGIVVAPPFDPRNVMVGEFRPVGGGANMPPQDEPSDSDIDETPQKSKPSDEAKPKSKVITYVLIVAAALGMGYVLFKKK
jgi:hypothetical protein